MTQAELDALPESGAIGQREEVRDGRRVTIPYMIGGGALWEDDGDGVFTDSRGQRWRVGQLNGVRVKQQIPC